MDKKRGWLLPLFVSEWSYGIPGKIPETIENFWIWVALFALGTIGILILFISSKQTGKVEKIYREMLDKQVEMEKHQTLLLSSMSENIHGMVTQALKKEKERETEKAVPKRSLSGEKAVPGTGEYANIEERLLMVTSDLIEFLRLKSNKIEIADAPFNLNNVLNEVSGYICSKYKGKEVDFIFDINNNVPRQLIGDSLHLGQVINSILEHMMERLTTGELKLEISMYNTYEEKIELEFQFHDTGDGLDPEELESLFNPYYDEQSSSYHGLGLFVSNELTKMMDGTLSAQSQKGKGSSFTLTLPLEIFDKNNRRMYRLPEKVLTAKKVFIVDNNYHSALAIKKTFAYFRHEVTVLSREMFVKQMPNLRSYDIVVLHEELFSHRLTGYLKKLKEEKLLKIIALKPLLRREKEMAESEVVDVELYTPLTQERIFEMIVGMYRIPLDNREESRKEKEQKLKIYRSQIHETVGITRKSFTMFKEKTVLIVEDNRINQKVLSSLLVPAGVRILLANNGREAVDMIQQNTAPFDLVLMDINMPILDGYAATEMIRQNPAYDTLPIIAFTALVLNSEIEKMYSCGINAFLPKPLNIGKLYTALALFLTEENAEPSVIDSEVEKEEKIPAYQGLDIVHGIAHANNNKVLYMEILSEFMEAYGKSDILFKKLVSEYRYEQIKMLCIDMRGLTGTIGAQKMLEVVNTVHKAILYKNEATLPQLIETYHRELVILNRAIQNYLADVGYKAA